jgi:hypothetical protein
MRFEEVRFNALSQIVNELVFHDNYNLSLASLDLKLLF